MLSDQRFLFCLLPIITACVFAVFFTNIKDSIFQTTTSNSKHHQASNQQPSNKHHITMETSKILQVMRKMVPPLTSNSYKGQNGRIGVVGGSEEYTGAPYFAAISALKVGADLVHVFCAKQASTVIKTYSPELIVLPFLDCDEREGELMEWLNKMHSIVIGPGLGRNPQVFEKVKKIITHARSKDIPLVIDADGLFLLNQDLSLIKGYKKAVLTPNQIEYQRLAIALNVNIEGNNNSCKEITTALNGPVVLKKSKIDVISGGNDKSDLELDQPLSPRRCGGQGDLLSGSLATFMYWAHSRRNHLEPTIDETDASMISAWSASFLTRNCARRAYIKNKRSATTSDLIDEISEVFGDLFDVGC